MFLTRNMTPQPLMDCFAAHQSYKDSIKARRALKKKKEKAKKTCFFSNFLVCVKLKSTAKQESIQSNFLFPIELHALNLRNTCHFAVEENLVVLCVCVCVLLHYQRFPGGGKISVSLSSHTSCQVLWNTKLLIGPALGFPPGSETVISGPLLGSQREPHSARLLLSWQVSVISQHAGDMRIQHKW